MNFPTTPRELDKVLGAMQAQGKPKAELQAVYDAYKKRSAASSQSFGEKFVQNVKKAPEAIFGSESIAGKTIGKIPLLKNVPEAIKDIGEMAIAGVEQAGSGLKDIKQSFGADMLSEGVTQASGGVSKIIGGGLQTAFAPPVAAAENIPVIGGMVKKGLETLGEGVDTVAQAVGKTLASDEAGAEVIRGHVNNLVMLLGAKYGPEAANKLTETLKPFAETLGEKIATSAESAPKVQMGKPLPEVIKIAEEQGIELPISATTGSEFIRSVEALQKNGIFSGDLLAKSETAATKIADLTSKAVDTLKTSDLSKFDIGQTFEKGFADVKKNFKEMKSDLYDAAQAQLDNANIKTKFLSHSDTAITNAALDELIGSAKKSLVPGQGLSYFEQLKNGLAGNKVTLDTLRQTLKDIGKKMGDNNDPIATGNRAELSKLYASLASDLDNIYSAKIPAFKDAIKTANDYYKQNIELINGKFGSMVEKATPEQIYDKFVKPNNPTALGELKQIVGKDSFAKIGGVFLKDLLNKSIKNEKFSIDSFNKEISKWDSETLTTIFNKTQLARLEEVKSQLSQLNKIQDALKAGESKFKGSQTGFLNAVNKLKTLFAGGGGAGAYLAAGLPGVIISALLYVIGDAATSKFLLSDFAKKLVSTGIELPGIKTLGNVGEFLSKNANAISQILSETTVKSSVGSPTQTQPEQ